MAERAETGQPGLPGMTLGDVVRAAVAEARAAGSEIRAAAVYRLPGPPRERDTGDG